MFSFVKLFWFICYPLVFSIFSFFFLSGHFLGDALLHHTRLSVTNIIIFFVRKIKSAALPDKVINGEQTKSGEKTSKKGWAEKGHRKNGGRKMAVENRKNDFQEIGKMA